MMKRILSMLLLALLTQFGYAQLTTPEKKMTAYVSAHMPDAIGLLTESVNINSGTLNKSGVKKVGDIYIRELQKLGFTTQWVNEPDALNRAGHLVATHPGKKGKKLLLMGHMDTVFEPDMPAGPYTMLNDSTATGQGVNDMKGGNVVIITALQALQNAGVLADMNIVVYFTGDEERAGTPHELARQDLVERAKKCDIALSFEAAGGLHQVVAARRGSSGWVLHVTAKTGHSAGVFSEGSGYGAIYEAARILNSFREELGNERNLTFNPGIIVGGSEIKIDTGEARGVALGKTNIISPTARVTGDLRYISDAQKDEARKKMIVIVAKSLNGTHSTITFTDGLPSMEPTPGNMALVKTLDQVSRDMGIGPVRAGDPGTRGAGDVSDVAKYVDCLDGLGVSGSGAHKAGETIHLKEFPLLIERTAVLIFRLTR